jgi:cell division protein FtsW
MKRKSVPKIDYFLLTVVLILLTIGILVLSSASTVLSYSRYDNNYYFLLRQVLYGVLPGLILLYVCSRIDYHFWQKIAPLLVFIGMGLLLLVFVPKIGLEVGNARRWINFGEFLFQPAEFVKLAMIFYLASWYDKRQQHVDNLYYGFLPSLVIVGIVAGLIMMQPDIGTMLVLGVIAFVLFMVGGVKLRYLFATLLAAMAVMWLAIKAAPYRMERIVAYFNPDVDTRGISYQINQALLAIGSGGWWGTGFYQSRQKYNYLPEPIGDSIFAIMSEELGFIRVTLILLLLLLFAYRGYKIARTAPDTFGQLAAAGITSWIVFQGIINIGGITNLIPLTGIPLPFISYGSSALIVTLAGMGVLLNISRYSGLKEV